MKIRILFAIFLSGMVFSLGCTSGESSFRQGYDFSKVDKIAVVDVVGSFGGEAAKNQIADFFTMELLKKGYSPVERAQVQSLLNEQKFQAGDITSATDAARAGQILNVPTVLVVNVPKFNEEINITAKMVNVEDASVLWLASGSGTTGKTLATIFGAAGGAGAGVAVSGKDNANLGGVIGGVLGGVAGRALSPQQAEKAKEIVTKMCKDLPNRNTMVR